MTNEPSIERVFRELSQIEPDGNAAVRAVEHARETISTRPVVGILSRWVGAVSGRYLAAAAGLVIAASLALWFALGGSNGAVAIAEVLQQLEAVKTVQYVETRSDIPRDGKPRGPTVVTRVQILGRYRQRKEIISVTPGEDLGEGSRWSQGPELEGLVSIVDLQQGRMVSLSPKDKRFHVIQKIMGISPDDGSLHESEVKPVPEADFYQQMRAIPTDEAEKLAERIVDGKSAVGFRTVEAVDLQGGTDTLTRTYWVDAKSKLPVRIEVEHRSTVPRHGQSRWVHSDFVFDAPLDESLFSTDPPEGYTNARESAEQADDGE
jgi:hypothetical protein